MRTFRRCAVAVLVALPLRLVAAGGVNHQRDKEIAFQMARGAVVGVETLESPKRINMLDKLNSLEFARTKDPNRDWSLEKHKIVYQ